jgi:hypothetical protein
VAFRRRAQAQQATHTTQHNMAEFTTRESGPLPVQRSATRRRSRRGPKWPTVTGPASTALRVQSCGAGRRISRHCDAAPLRGAAVRGPRPPTQHSQKRAAVRSRSMKTQQKHTHTHAHTKPHTRTLKADKRTNTVLSLKRQERQASSIHGGLSAAPINDT